MSDSEVRVEDADAYLTILSTEGLRNLGLIAYWAAWVENVLYLVALEWVASDRQTAVLLLKGKTAGFIADLMIDIVKTDRVTGSKDGAALALAIQHAVSALRSRNQVLHSAIGGAVAQGHVALYRKDSVEPRIVPESQLDDVAMDLRAAAEKLGDCI